MSSTDLQATIAHMGVAARASATVAPVVKTFSSDERRESMPAS